MKIKLEYIALAVVILAIALYLFLRSPDRTHYELPQLPQISTSALSRIQITKSGTVLSLVREGETWCILPRQYPADGAKVHRMVDALKDITLTALVSESREFDRYGLTDEQKITVRAWEGENEIRHVTLGKAAPSSSHTFLQPAGDHRVYHARGNLKPLFDLTEEDMRDRQVLSFSKNEIHEMAIIKGDEHVRFIKKQSPTAGTEVKEGRQEAGSSTGLETVWQGPEGQDVDMSKLDRLLYLLVNLRCEKYLTAFKKEELGHPVYSLRLKGTEEYELDLFEKTNPEDRNHPATSSQNDYVFMLQESQIPSIMIDPADLLKETPKPEEPHQASGKE